MKDKLFKDPKTAIVQVATFVVVVLFLLSVSLKLAEMKAEVFIYYILGAGSLLLLIWFMREKWKSQRYLRFCISATISYFLYLIVVLLCCLSEDSPGKQYNTFLQCLGFLIFLFLFAGMIIYVLINPYAIGAIKTDQLSNFDSLMYVFISFFLYTFIIWGIWSLFVKKKQAVEKIAENKADETGGKTEQSTTE